MGKKVSIANQITSFIVVACLINMFCSMVVSYFNLQNMFDKSTLIQNIDMAVHIADSFRARADNGEISTEEAQNLALQAIGAIRYEGNNYIWVNDYNTVMLTNPTVPRNSDASIIKDKSPEGKTFFKNITEGAKASKDGSYRESYKWVKPGSDKPMEKHSYGIIYPEWKWVIATGLYVNDINAVLFDNFKNIVIVNIIMTILVVISIRLLFISKLAVLLRNIAGSLSNSTTQVSNAATSLEDSSHKLADGTTEQAGSLQEIAATVEESASMIQRCEESTKIAAELAKSASQEADEGTMKMQRLMETVEKINTSSNAISNIIKTIDAIAFQTNILSLNAAVEATKAGDAGKGFAVVAEEVRNLAKKSTQSASETAILISNNVTLYDEASKMAEDVSKSMNGIKNQTSKVSNLINEIASATHEQSIGIVQIHSAMSKVEEVLQINKDTAEETSSDSEHLTSQTAMLNNLAANLTTIVEGSH